MSWVFYLLIGLATLLGMLLLLLIVRARGLTSHLVQWVQAAVTWIFGLRKHVPTVWRALSNIGRATRESVFALVASSRERYAAPWVLVTGSAESGKTSLLAALKPHEPALQLPTSTVPDPWHHLGEGVAIEIPLASSESRAFRSALTRLDQLRPERPADAIVLTVPADLLVGRDVSGVATQAHELTHRLWVLQAHFCLVLPIYLVITKCDRIPGFRAFCSIVDVSSSQIFGWSSPAQLGQCYADSELAAAFLAMCQRMRLLQLSALHRGIAADAVADFLEFPQQFLSVLPALSLLCSQVFGTTIRHNAPHLRGVYFSGRLSDDAPPAFVSDLFIRKVFVERHLAIAQPRRIWSRSPALRRVQRAIAYGCAAFVLAVFVSAAHLAVGISGQTKAVLSVSELTRVPAGERARLVNPNGPLANPALVEPSSAYLLFPWSWFDSRLPNRRSRFVATALLEAAVFPTLSQRLETITTGLMATSVNGAPAPPDGRHQHSALLERVAAVNDWEEVRVRFQNLIQAATQAQSTSVADLRYLLESQLGLTLPKEWNTNNDLLRLALARAKPRSAVFQNVVEQRKKFAYALPGLAVHEVEQLRAAVLRGFGACKRLGSTDGSSQDLETIVAFGKGISRDWFNATEAHNPCRSLQGALTLALANLRELAPGYPEASLDEAVATFSTERCYSPIADALNDPTGSWCRQFLETSTSESTTPILDRVRIPSILKGLVPQTAAGFELQIRAVEQAGFMRAVAWPTFKCQSPIGWKQDRVAAARDLLLEYLKFQGQPGVSELAELPGIRKRLAAAVAGELELAQITMGPNRDVSKADNAAPFAAVSADFLQIVSLMSQLGYDATTMIWAPCMQDYAVYNLLKLDHGVPPFDLESASIDVSSAIGSTATFFPALADAATSDSLFKSELSRLAARELRATPLVQWLIATSWLTPLPEAAEALVQRFGGTIEAIQAGVTSSPAIVALHTFFQTVLTGLHDSNCNTRLANAPSVAGVDEFSLALGRLYAQAQSLCREHADAQKRARYQTIADAFELTLQGRFPFAPLTAPDAAPDDIAALSKLLQSPDCGALGVSGARDRASVFVRQLRDAIALLSGGSSDRDPLRVGVVSRTLPIVNRATQDILTWSLTAATDSVTYPNGRSTIGWQHGTPVSFALQWADRSAYRPMGDSKQPALAVLGASARFQYRGTLSLLRLIETHRVSQAAGVSTTDSVAIQFLVPTNGLRGAATPELARVVLELSLEAQDGSTLRVGPFPRSAPPFSLPTGERTL